MAPWALKAMWSQSSRIRNTPLFGRGKACHEASGAWEQNWITDLNGDTLLGRDEYIFEYSCPIGTHAALLAVPSAWSKLLLVNDFTVDTNWTRRLCTPTKRLNHREQSKNVFFPALGSPMEVVTLSLTVLLVIRRRTTMDLFSTVQVIYVKVNDFSCLCYIASCTSAWAPDSTVGRCSPSSAILNKYKGLWLVLRLWWCFQRVIDQPMHNRNWDGQTPWWSKLQTQNEVDQSITPTHYIRLNSFRSSWTAQYVQDSHKQSTRTIWHTQLLKQSKTHKAILNHDVRRNGCAIVGM